MSKPRLACLVATVVLCLAAPASAEKQKRTRYFELQPTAGYSWVNLIGFSQRNFYASVDSQDVSTLDPRGALEDGRIDAAGHGPSAGIAASGKLAFFVLGCRYAGTSTQDFDLHTLGADIGIRLDGLFAFYLRTGLGYAWIGGLSGDFDSTGLAFPLGLGVDLRFSEPFSVGLGVEGDVLLLSHDLGSAKDIVRGEGNNNDVAALDGSSAGFQARPQLHFTWHI